ncbi:hypothetical protein FACS1894217_02940 [Clostridia bacterium]|nr:hypothetical protein FACS1894217_02940 [Clostridia bacterium]
MKKRLAVITAVMLVLMLALAACSSNTTDPSTSTKPSGNGGTTTDGPTGGGTAGQAKFDGDGNRIIRIGTWYEHFYQSSNEGPEADETSYLNGPEGATARYENMKAVEEKLKVKFEWVRMTFEGIMVDLEEGTMSGLPSVDLYEADLQFGLPAALGGYCVSLDDLAPDGSDPYKEDPQVMKFMEIPGVDTHYLMAPYNPTKGVYALGFNWTLLKSKGLENPQDLWDRGEWTWEKYKEYCTALTDTAATPPVYGMTGYWTNNLDGFMLSNDTGIATGKTETLTDPKTGAVINLFKELYVDLKVAKPWDPDDWEKNNTSYADGNIGFFVTNTWMLKEQGGGPELPLTFEIGVVPYPVGPSGDKDKNFHNKVSGNWYIIPRGVENPQLVYDAWFDYNNWYDGDYANTKQYDIIADDEEGALEWWMDELVTAAHGNKELEDNNIRLFGMMSDKETMDIWGSLNSDFSLVEVMNGEKTPAQLQEENKQIIQDKLDGFFGG